MTDKNIVFNYNRKSWKETLDFISTLNSGNILDLGCGNGNETAILCKKGLNVTALDISDELINEAKKKAPEAKFIKADIRTLPIENSSIDNALFIATFHHLKNNNDRLKCLKELHRCIKPNGRVLMSVWTKKGMKGGKYLSWGSSSKKRYYYFFEKQELLNLVEMSGFKVINSKNSGENLFVEFQK